MVHEIEQWISEALERSHLGSRKIATPEAKTIRSGIEHSFVTGNPRVWWLGFTIKPEIWMNHERSLHEFFDDPDAPGWFIPETEDSSNGLVYRLSAREVELVILDCPYFEYYFINDERSCLVAENDHNAFLICRLPSQKCSRDGFDKAENV